MKNVKVREIIILTISLLILVNFVYFRYIHKNYLRKRNELIQNINDYDVKISNSIFKFHKNLNILKTIALIKKDILFSKKKIELLNSNRTTTFDMSNILKTLLVKSGVSIYGVTLSKIITKKAKSTYSFKVQISDKLDKILRFMDLIENYSDNMYIPTYTIKPKDGLYNVNMVVNFDYVGKR